MSQIKKILVANRGEIAIRVMQTAKRMGIKTVAVYSSADRNALHVKTADEAVYIGNAPSSESYLVKEKIIQAAKDTGSDAIHPGYGFLSENAAFSKLVADAGLTFIGPSAHAIEVMGSKLAAKEAVKPLGVPMVPGTDEAISSHGNARKAAIEVGFPILIKASAGGGGKGMRVVHSEDELDEQMDRAISEAESAFGDGSVFIEKYIEQPRHIEVQVLFDNHGNGVYLFDRECSIQRRHQKVVEEAPATNLPEDVRQKMGEAALKAGQAVNYSGAGTVEFLADKHYNFYFLEMNTRLQVEHPVTEMITGVDLVEEQIRIAQNETLRLKQAELTQTGHAIELRLYAEDPENNFLPSTGTLERYYLPEIEGIRFDNGYEEGDDVPIYYDPMLAKIVSYGANRTEAIARLKQAISQFELKGIKSTLPFGTAVLRSPAFIEERYSTNFIKENYTTEDLFTLEHDPNTIAHLAKHLYEKERRRLVV